MKQKATSMNYAVPIVILVVCALCEMVSAQADTATTASGSVRNSSQTASAVSAETPVVLKPRIAKYDYDAMPKDPLASAMFSVVLPGLGQLYNKEYLRAGVTAVVFYGTFFGAQYLLNQYTAYNTDTFFIAEYPTDPEKPIMHTVTAPKPENDWRWRSSGEKAAFIGCAVVAAGSWVFNLFDAYNGAKRYNAKLAGQLSFDQHPVLLGVSPDLKTASVSLNLTY